jgi:hypothetical protein
MQHAGLGEAAVQHRHRLIDAEQVHVAHRPMIGGAARDAVEPAGALLGQKLLAVPHRALDEVGAAERVVAGRDLVA